MRASSPPVPAGAAVPAIVPALTGHRNQLGEGALWHARTERLYWIDIAGHTAHAYEPATGRVLTALLGESVGTLVPTRRGEVLVALQRQFAFLDFSGARLAPFPQVPLLPPDHRFNDGKCDPAGRLWVGSMSIDAAAHQGALWCLGADLQADRRRTGLSIPNGIAWSRDGLTLYHADSTLRQIEAFDFDPVGGALANARTLRLFAPDEGVPDGMTIDAAGHLWVALWDGWRVVRIHGQTGATLAEIALPVQRPTSCAFGGPALDTLYITSAQVHLTAAELAAQPLAGGLFAVQPAVCGVPAYEFAG